MMISRSVAGSHLIALRRKRASFKKSTQTITEGSPSQHNSTSNVKTYVIPGFAKFEFLPRAKPQDNIYTRSLPPSMEQVNIKVSRVK